MDIQGQVAYYNHEWSIADRRYPNLNQLTRAIAILQELLETHVSQPRICELGAGTGWLTSLLGSIGETLGVELSNVAVETAQKRYGHVAFECADITHWQGHDSQFDVAVSHEVIEHIEDQCAYLDVAHDVLRPGGFLILTTPNARTVRATPEAHRSHQPIENILTCGDLALLLRKRFEDVHIRSVLLTGANAGLYRVINSARFHAMLASVGLKRVFVAAALRANYGLHLVARARKPPS